MTNAEPVQRKSYSKSLVSETIVVDRSDNRKALSVDRATVSGILLALIGLGLGLHLEGCRISDIVQPAAACIVFAGTLGAVLMQYPMSVVLDSLRSTKIVLLEDVTRADRLWYTLLLHARDERRAGLLALDSKLAEVEDQVVRKALALAIDGSDARSIRTFVHSEMDHEQQKEELTIQLFESAAGFAPTIGVLGAVVGLLQVMRSLGDMDLVGKGIAVSFVSTIYGVAIANLLFVPLGGKLRLRSEETRRIRELGLEAVLAISQGITPRALEFKLSGFKKKEMLSPQIWQVESQ